jgi:hypothetical protein
MNESSGIALVVVPEARVNLRLPCYESTQHILETLRSCGVGFNPVLTAVLLKSLLNAEEQIAKLIFIRGAQFNCMGLTTYGEAVDFTNQSNLLPCSPVASIALRLSLLNQRPGQSISAITEVGAPEGKIVSLEVLRGIKDGAPMLPEIHAFRIGRGGQFSPSKLFVFELCV